MKAYCTLLVLVIFLTANTEYSRQPSNEIPEMVKVAGGSFLMGQEDGESDERPVRSVTLDDFFIGKYEITVAQYRRFCSLTDRPMPEEPDWGWQENHPITNTTWYDATAYINWLNDRYDRTFRLPTEAEFEYVIRNGGKDGIHPWKSTTSINENIADESLRATISENRFWVGYSDGFPSIAPVGQLPANRLGVHDINGNIWEWCSDWYAAYSKQAIRNPTGPKTGTFKVGRGGSYNADPWHTRSASRSYVVPDFAKPGFRIAMDAP